jgi:peptidoglycan LD-endopeptidase LytH
MRRALVLSLLAVLAWAAYHMVPQLRTAWWLLSSEPPAAYAVPVRGVQRADLRGSFGVPRPAGRSHHGIDIMAPRGTPVVAAADGVVTSLRGNRLGGNVVWVLGAGFRTYYYAHLDAHAPGLRVGALVRAGDVIGTVGATGNARGGPPHLHFGVYDARPGPLPVAFTPVDPYPLLRRVPLRPSGAPERVRSSRRTSGAYFAMVAARLSR